MPYLCHIMQHVVAMKENMKANCWGSAGVGQQLECCLIHVLMWGRSQCQFSLSYLTLTNVNESCFPWTVKHVSRTCDSTKTALTLAENNHWLQWLIGITCHTIRVSTGSIFDRRTHTNLLQEPHEARRRHDADLPHKRLGYCHAPLLLAAASWVRLQQEGNDVAPKVNLPDAIFKKFAFVVLPPEGQSRSLSAGSPNGDTSLAVFASTWSWGQFVWGVSERLPPPSFQWAPSRPVSRRRCSSDAAN